MSRLCFICVGKTQAGFVQAGVEHYLGRLRAFEAAEWIEVRAASHSGRDRAKALRAEGEAIARHLDAKDWVIALDEAGRELTSPQLAQRLQALKSQGKRIVLLIGGAFGVAPELLERADERLSLSRMTLPHQLVRVVLVEQMYRALTILAGQPYHHGES